MTTKIVSIVKAKKTFIRIVLLVVDLYIYNYLYLLIMQRIDKIHNIHKQATTEIIFG